MNKTNLKIKCLKVFVLFVVVIVFWGKSSSSTQAKKFTKASVVYVIDGDTIIAKIKGKEIKVRMIGVNTPESVHWDESKNTKQGVIASTYAKKETSKREDDISGI